MHKEYILLNGFRKAKRGFTAGFHVPLMGLRRWTIGIHIVHPCRQRRLRI